MTAKEIKMFKRFLKDNKAYKAFFKSIDIYYDDFIGNCASDYLRRIHLRSVIECAFSWDSAPGGFDYWDSLNIYWDDYVDEMKWHGEY